MTSLLPKVADLIELCGSFSIAVDPSGVENILNAAEEQLDIPERRQFRLHTLARLLDKSPEDVEASIQADPTYKEDDVLAQSELIKTYIADNLVVRAHLRQDERIQRMIGLAAGIKVDPKARVH